MLVRHPTLRLAYSEGQIGWIPYILERADDVWHEHRAWGGVRDVVPEPPSTYWFRQIFGCFFRDRHGLESLHRIGEDNVTFETDYPHTDSTWPHTRKIFAEQVEGLRDDVVYKIGRGNAIRMCGSIPPRVAGEAPESSVPEGATAGLLLCYGLGPATSGAATCSRANPGRGPTSSASRPSAPRAIDELFAGTPAPQHLGILLENSPEYLFWIGGAAFAGAAIVDINPTRRGAELQRDIAHTDCRWLITDRSQLDHFDGVNLEQSGLPTE